jgi:hypothetical protein
LSKLQGLKLQLPELEGWVYLAFVIDLYSRRGGPVDEPADDQSPGDPGLDDGD